MLKLDLNKKSVKALTGKESKRIYGGGPLGTLGDAVYDNAAYNAVNQNVNVDTMLQNADENVQAAAFTYSLSLGKICKFSKEAEQGGANTTNKRNCLTVIYQTVTTSNGC